ncbi:MAG: polysaccharide biosynthesis protein, partial [Eudoraea sp.]|nr:polysaccharide biosynthesis protein [Eudoraea sp.]
MIQNYFTNTVYRYASKWVVLVIDLITVAIAFVLSYFIRFNFTFDFDVEKFIMQIPMVVIFAAVAFLFTGSYKGVIRHTGTRDVYNIFNAICLSSIIAIFVVLLNRQYGIYDEFTIPLSIIVINSFISFVALTTSRYVFKSIHHSMINKLKSNPKNVVIFGAGESGILTYNALTNHSKNPIKVVGYVDKDKQKIGKKINGVEVFSRRTLTNEFIVKKDISEIIFSIQNIDPRKLRKLIESLVDLPVKVKIVPPVEDWMNGELKVSQIKQVQIEDLLDRSPITIHNERIIDELKDKVVIVTGGAGSIGS